MIVVAGLAAVDAFANGGDQRVVEGKYLVNLARAPFTPRVGEGIAMLVSFVDIQKDALISEAIIVKLRIAKLGGIGTEKRTFVFERDDIAVSGGVLEFPYKFGEPGLHEIFFDFAFAANPGRLYEVPDFLIDVQGSSIPDRRGQLAFIGTAAAVLVGFGLGWFMGRLKRT